MFNPDKPSALFIGQRQNVQTHHAVADLIRHCLLTECSIKLEKYHPSPLQLEMARSNYKCRFVHSAQVG